MEEVTFSAWANGGAALGRLADGRVIFVQGAIPGERANVRFPKKEARFVAGEIEQLLTESEKRIPPRCPLFGICSGCQFQFIAYEEQLKAKREILTDHLKRIAKLADADQLLQPILHNEEIWGWKHSLILYVGDDGHLYLPEVHGQAVPMEAYCPICAKAINEIIPTLEFEKDSGIDWMEIRAGDNDELQLILHGQSEKPDMEIETDEDVSVIYCGPEDSYVMAGVSSMVQSCAGVRICASESSAFFANPAILNEVCAALEGFLPKEPIETLLNINCGTGFWSSWFCARCQNILAVSPKQTENDDFIYNLDASENVSLYLGELNEILPGLQGPIQVVMIDGGTSGLAAEAFGPLCAHQPDLIVYAAEDAAILARDCLRFREQNFLPQAILPYDPAPQTAEIHALMILRAAEKV